MTNSIEKTVSISAPPAVVWEALTTPDLMKQWMADPEVGLDINTNWTIGSPLIIKGFLHKTFENKGTVLQFEPSKILEYSHLNSLSRLSDAPQNYSSCEFKLVPDGERTSLTITIRGFPTESIFKHLNFYWRVTAGILKKFIEARH
jgi:uncharacterized protein YndB with AHSA1/START domain